MNGDQIEGLNKGYMQDLYGLGKILDLWLVRDIRFIVTPRSLTDARRRTERFLTSQAPAVEAIAEALVFQLGDWDQTAPLANSSVPHVGNETGLPVGADRDLVLEAQAISAHIFLTRDKRVLTRTQLSGPQLAVMAPATVAEKFEARDVQIFSGGICTSHYCPYREWALPFPDTGKWGPLLGLFS